MRVKSANRAVDQRFDGTDGGSEGPGRFVAAEGQRLAYRLRRPVGQGRGHQVVVACSADGVEYQPVVTLSRTQLDAESLERSAPVPLPDGGWRLYLSCATPGSSHWWIEALDAAELASLGGEPVAESPHGGRTPAVRQRRCPTPRWPPAVLRGGPARRRSRPAYRARRDVVWRQPVAWARLVANSPRPWSPSQSANDSPVSCPASLTSSAYPSSTVRRSSTARTGRGTPPRSTAGRWPAASFASGRSK